MRVVRRNKSRVALIAIVILTLSVTTAFSLAPLQTWSLTSTTANWKAVACSDVCDVQYAAVYAGYIFKSTDGGGSWNQLTAAGSRNWNSLATSGDGSYVTAVDYGGYIYRSSDGGSTWAQVAISGNWRAIAMNQAGDVQLAGIVSGNLYSSADFGQTWTAQGSAGIATWGALDLNAAGTLAVAGGKPGNIWIGTNSSGTWSWSNKTGSGQTALSGTDASALNLKGWSGFVLSETGTRIVAPINLVEVPDGESLDIDTFSDWAIAEHIVSRKRILLRTDAARELGMGHVYRTLALAQTLARHEITIVLSADKPLGAEFFAEYPFEVATVESDLEFLNYARRQKADLVVVTNFSYG